MRTTSPLRRVVGQLHRHPASALVIGRSVGFAAAFAIPIVLSRILDQTEFGTYKQLFLIYATLFGVAQLGMAESLYYFIPRDSNGAGQHIASALATLAAAGVGCLTLLILFSAGIAGWLKNPQLTPGLLPLGIFLILTLVAAPLEIVLVSRRKYGSAALTYAVSDLMRVACVLSPAIVIGTISSVMWGAAGFAFARLGATVWTLRRDLVTSFEPNVVDVARAAGLCAPLCPGSSRRRDPVQLPSVRRRDASTTRRRSRYLQSVSCRCRWSTSLPRRAPT